MLMTPSVRNEASTDQLIRALAIGVYICDVSGHITSYNQKAADLWGREPDLARDLWTGAAKMTKADGSITQPDECTMALILKTKREILTQELVIIRPDGSQRIVLEQSKLLYSEGNITGALTQLTDITEQKAAEKHSATLASIFESSEDAIVSKTLSGIITSWNPGAERLFGYTAQEMIGSSISRLFPPDRLDEENEIIGRIVKGERVEHFDTQRVNKNGELLDISLTISPIKDKNGNIIGASKIARDITTQKGLNKALSKSEQKFRNIVMLSPVAMLVLKGPGFIVEIVNHAYLEIVDRKPHTLVNKPLLSALPELESQGIKELLTQVFNTGIPVYGNEFPVKLMRNGRLEQLYFNFSYQPDFDVNGNVTGITVVAFDVTSLIRSKLRVEESEKRFRSLVMQSPIAMTIFRGPDHIIEMANTEMVRNVWRKEESSVIGKKALEVFPELKEQKYPELLKKVLLTGKSHREKESLAYVQGDDGMKRFYLDYEYSPLQESDGSVSGIMITVYNVTERVEALMQLGDAETRLRLAAEGTGLATWDLDLISRDIIHSPHLAELFGHPASKTLTHQQMRDQVHPEDRQNIVEKAFEQAMISSQYFYEARVIWPDKTIRWIRTLGKVYFDDQYKPLRMLGTMRDITPEKISQKAIEESEQRLNLAIEAAELGTWELNLKDNKLSYSKRYIQMFGFPGDAIVNHAELIRYIHPDDLPIRQSAFNEAMRTGILHYEARIILKDQSVRWIKAKGKVFVSTYNKPERMLGTIQDITSSKVIEEELEKRVKNRTKELQQVNIKLAQSNQELEQYAYVASHDLQEPLRKIRTYSGLLLQNLQGNTDSTSIITLEKVISSAERMSTLIYDLLNFSRLLKPETSYELVDLNEIIKNVCGDLELVIQQKKALIQFTLLPVIEAIPLQMGQLFYNLINNSLKFSKKDETPTITIDCSAASLEEVKNHKMLNPELHYIKIRITDNGIGFDQENAEQIFEVFKRLHNKTAYPGSGIGLALCRKITLNHQGYITATGTDNQGSVFHLFLPVQQQTTVVDA